MASEGGFTDQDGDDIPQRDYTDWHETVMRYTSLMMTVKSDRLTELAGIVKRMVAARPRDTYLAGLWESTLLSDLLRDEGNNPLDKMQRGGRRTNRQLPSFSWGSVDSYISYATKGYTPLDTVTVLQVHYVPSGPVVLGRPAEAYIKIKSPILKGTLISSGPEEDDRLKVADLFKGETEDDIPFQTDSEFEALGDFQEPCSDVAVLFLLQKDELYFQGLVL